MNTFHILLEEQGIGFVRDYGTDATRITTRSRSYNGAVNLRIRK
jgi:hypothetical protein